MFLYQISQQQEWPDSGLGKPSHLTGKQGEMDTFSLNYEK